MPKQSTAARITGAEVCAAAVADAPAVAIAVIVGGILFLAYATANACGWSSYDCTTPWKRLINWCH